MTDTQQTTAPAPLQPVPDAQNLLSPTAAAGACCGGDSCGV